MKRLAFLIIIVMALGTSSAFAQDFGGTGTTGGGGGGGTPMISNSGGGAGGAAQAVGKIGLGYTTQNAPVGVRMWFAPNMGFDANLGIVINGEENDPENPGDTQTTVDFAVDAAFLYAFVQSENSLLYVRGSLNYDRRYAQGQNNNGEGINSSVDTFSIGAWLGAEFFMTALGFPEIGLQAAFGLGVQVVSPPEQVGDEQSDWSIGTLTTGLSFLGSATLGFHYYF